MQCLLPRRLRKLRCRGKSAEKLLEDSINPIKPVAGMADGRSSRVDSFPAVSAVS